MPTPPKKHIIDLLVVAAEHPRTDYVLLRLTNPDGPLPTMLPGQFVEVLVENSTDTFLRRPISINRVCRESNELWLLIHAIGAGTRTLSDLRAGNWLNCLLPLGNGFSIPEGKGKRLLLVGGGVGTAPLLHYGEELLRAGHEPTFLLGGRTANDVLQMELFEQVGRVFVTTEDGSAGERGYVTQHSLLTRESFDGIATCGPKPMMMAVAAYANKCNTPCEASLENLMACGLGACLCCVEKNNEGHNVCVCKEGPVFNTEKLSWQN